MTGMPFCSDFDSGSYVAIIKAMAQHVLHEQENLGRDFSNNEIISKMIQFIDCGLY